MAVLERRISGERVKEGGAASVSAEISPGGRFCISLVADSRFSTHEGLPGLSGRSPKVQVCQVPPC